METSQMDAQKRPVPLHIGKPAWLKTPIPTGSTYFAIKKDLSKRKLPTVCEEAKCPNIGVCWNTRTATFMILGDTCTRACRFCHIKTGNPHGWLDTKEPEQVAQSAKGMNLSYIVLTMVNRDDLADGGAAHARLVIEAVRKENPGIRVEFLAGDFQGHEAPLDTVLQSGLDVFAHNVETVRRLTPRVRDARAHYDQSLHVLDQVKKKAPTLFTKSALMLGLGETREEIRQTLQDLRAVEVDLVTVGQYMRPTKQHLAIKEWVHPDIFAEIKQEALDVGFVAVASGPLVRSSYKAAEFFAQAQIVREGKR
jgi:lipoic acid synthetase